MNDKRLTAAEDDVLALGRKLIELCEKIEKACEIVEKAKEDGNA